jgi:hypothetical protein
MVLPCLSSLLLLLLLPSSYGRCWDCILPACRPYDEKSTDKKACLLPLVLAVDFWLAKSVWMHQRSF